MDYVSPGDAFSSSLEQSLLARHQQERQDQADRLAMQKEARQSRIQDEERQQAREALAEKRQEFADSQKDKQKAAFTKSLDTMLPGDIPSPDMVDQAKSFGLGHLFPEAPVETPPPPSPAPLPVPMPAVAPEGGIPNPTVAPPEGIAALPQGGGVRFLGSPKQRTDDTDKAALQAYVETLPDGPEKKAQQYFLMTGKQAPAGMFRAAPGADVVGQFRHDSQGNAQRSVIGIDGRPGWQDWAGDVPKDAHWAADRPAPVPKDHSTQDAEALRKAYDSAVTELNTRAKPIEGHVSAINDLGMALNERTPQADALIAPLVLKATVSGTGTGFRMTQSEINQVIGGRSKWDSLSAALNKWSLDPTQALSITDEQRTELRSLAKAVRTKAATQMNTIIETRHALDDATDPKDIKKLRTKLQDALSKGEGADGAGSQPKSAADYLKEYNAKNGRK